MPIISSERFARPRNTGNDLTKPVPEDRWKTLLEEAPLRVVLFQPEIPQNTGNVARTCAATGTPLHLVEPLGFHLTDRHLKRAGLDYWDAVCLKVHPDLEALRKELSCNRLVFFSTHAQQTYDAFCFCPGDCLVFGSETKGLPQDLLHSSPGCVLRIPIDRSRVRSLNLATTVGVALFEAMRQLTRCGNEEERL